MVSSDPEAAEEIRDVGSRVGASDRDVTNADVDVERESLFQIDTSHDDKMVTSGAYGALTARPVDDDPAVAWSIDDREAEIGFVAFEDGCVWTTLSERTARSRDPDIGIVGFLLDRDELVRFAQSKLGRDLTDGECQQFHGLTFGADRLADLR